MKHLLNWAIPLTAAVALAGTAMAQPYQEAPELAVLVAEGQLPAVEERLPANPLIVNPIEMVGTYGGVWRSALKGSFDTGWIRRTIGYQPLVAFNYDWTEVVPNVAERYEVNEDATEFTFYLREGHKWSDGEPFTAEDLAFALKVMSSPEYTGRKVNVPLAGATGEVVDPTTFKIKLVASCSLKPTQTPMPSHKSAVLTIGARQWSNPASSTFRTPIAHCFLRGAR